MLYPRVKGGGLAEISAIPLEDAGFTSVVPEEIRQIRRQAADYHELNPGLAATGAAMQMYVCRSR